jgi:hypothetical protein
MKIQEVEDGDMGKMSLLSNRAGDDGCGRGGDAEMQRWSDLFRMSGKLLPRLKVARKFLVIPSE